MANPLNIRPFFKFLSRNILYTAINIFGLSVSLMFVILAGLYAYKQISVDSWHEKKNRIYALGDEDSIGSSYAIQPYLLGVYPEIEKMAAVTAHRWQLQAVINGEKVPVTTLYADSTFFDLFDFRVIEGDPKGILSGTSQAMISESFARKVFGNEDPIGTVIDMEGRYTVSVAGIMEDIRNSVFPESDIIVSIQNLPKVTTNITLENTGNVMQFILTREGTDLVSKKDDILGYFQTFFPYYQEDEWGQGAQEVTLTPFNDIYFSDLQNGMLVQGDKSATIMLSIITLLILIFAVLNYINLTVAQTGFRAKEMATRRFLGASPREIFTRFIMESILMCAVAFIIALLLAGALQYPVGNLFQARIDVWRSITWEIAGVFALFVVLLGTVAGIIPAIHITRYQAIDVVRGTFRQRSKMIFSKVFIVFQNVITIALIGCSLTIIFQIRHMMNVPLGYNTENIIYAKIREALQERKILSLASEVEKLPGVKRISLTNGYPLHGGSNNTVTYDDGKEVAFQEFYVDSLFFDIMGIKVIRDNHVAPGKGYWVNERLFLELGLPEDAEYFELYDDEKPLISGVIEDFKLWNALSRRERVIIVRVLPRGNHFWGMLIEVDGEKTATLNEIKDLYKTMFERELEAKYTEDELYEGYEEQRRLYSLLMMFAIIGVVISMLGLLAMSTYYIQQHSVEIAIRKVFGSTRGEVFNRLVRNFLKLVIIAFIIAIPVIWYLMRLWLSQFPYRINLSPWIFLAAGALAMVIAAITVMWQSARAADSNPIDSLHKE